MKNLFEKIKICSFRIVIKLEVLQEEPEERKVTQHVFFSRAMKYQNET